MSRLSGSGIATYAAAAAAAAAAGTLGFFLWAAYRAPVVLWSDSHLDLDLARTPLGFLAGAPDHGGPMHPVKPFFIAFLRMAVLLFSDPARAVVVTQSTILALSIVGTAAFVGRRRGAPAGWACGALFVAGLSARDAASAVMPEALTIAILLPIVAFLLLDGPASVRGAAGTGLAIGALFFVRSNAGVAALILALAAALWEARRARLALTVVAGFLAIWIPVSAARRIVPHPPARSGVSTGLVTACLDYGWGPLAKPWPAGGSPREVARAEFDFAASRWRGMRHLEDPDVRRQWLWRIGHGTLGSDYYDARWSPLYRRLDDASRELRPFLTLIAIALLIGALAGRASRRAGCLGVLLLLLSVAQNVTIGSLPRFGLPYLLPLWLLGVVCFRPRALPAAGIVFVLLAAAVFRVPGIVDREWGMLEKSGIAVRQKIPRGAMKARRALRVRIASLTGLTSAGLSVLDDRGRELFASEAQAHPERPEIVIPLPLDLRERNARQPIELRFVTRGTYDATNFYVFPVVPPPWSPAAIREGSALLSPGTGIARGGLDWW